MKHLISVILFLCSLFLVKAQTIETNKRIENDSVYLDYINPFYAPLELNINALDSVKLHIRVKPYALLKYRDTLFNAVVIPISIIKDTTVIRSTDYIKFKGNFGNPNSVIDENYRYTLPFPKGRRYKIIQSFGGKFSHNRPSSRYAIDFGTQIGDTITAARGGKVFFVKEDSKEYCKTRKCVDKGNKVLILHSDGTMAHYVHLDFDGALVKVGDEVIAGQPIAISGMTGFTTTPHLHLVVYKAKGISIPFYFKGQKTKQLKKGKFYRRKY